MEVKVPVFKKGASTKSDATLEKTIFTLNTDGKAAKITSSTTIVKKTYYLSVLLSVLLFTYHHFFFFGGGGDY